MKFRFRVHPAGMALLGAAFLFCPSAEVLAAVISLAWHEGAHLVAMYFCGIRECTVEITPFGGMADSREFEKLTPLKQAVCSAAGVAASAAEYAGFLPYAVQNAFFQAMVQMNLSLLFVNCLPFWPLDGARVITALASLAGMEHAVRKFLALLARLAGIGLTALGLYGAWMGWINPSLLLCGPYLCYAAAQGTLSQRVRRVTALRNHLGEGTMLPVHMFVCASGNGYRGLAGILGRNEWGRYHVLLVIDPASGAIVRTITEQEALEDIVGS